MLWLQHACILKNMTTVAGFLLHEKKETIICVHWHRLKLNTECRPNANMNYNYKRTFSLRHMYKETCTESQIIDETKMADVFCVCERHRHRHRHRREHALNLK